MDHYAVLGVDPDADQATIESAYRKRVKTVHPDRNDAPDADEQFRRVKKAYEVLSDPETRARYDRQREQRITANDPGRGEYMGGGSGRGRTTGSMEGDPGRWADAHLDEWLRAERKSQQQREKRARARRRRRHRTRGGSEWEVGEAPNWYAANVEMPGSNQDRRPRSDPVVLGLVAAYGLGVVLTADPLGLVARLIVGLVTLMTALFVLRVPEVALPTVGVVVTVILPTIALIGLPALSAGAVVGGLAIAVPTAAVALFVRLR